MMRPSTLIAICAAASGCSPVHEPPRVDGDPERGRAALRAHECGACHVIPGVAGPQSHMGPSLEAYAHRVYLAGKFPNTPELLVAWIQDAPSLAPRTAMPAFQMNEGEARDIAAYLYSLQ